MTSGARSRPGLFVAVSALIAIAAILIALRGPSQRAGGDDGASSAGDPLPPALSAPERELAEERHFDAQAGGEDLHGHDEEPPPGLEWAARDFLGFYLRYEVGQASGAIEAGLRDTATPEFAAELLGAAPRLPPGLTRTPVGARLLAVDVVPLADENGVARVVGKLRRGGDLEAVAFELRRSSGRWLVSGVAG